MAYNEINYKAIKARPQRNATTPDFLQQTSNAFLLKRFRV